MSVSRTQIYEKLLEPEEWVDAYGDDFYRYARALLRDPGSAEEVVQETFLAGIQYHAEFAGNGCQRAWLLRILKRKVVDVVRSRTRLRQSREYEPDPTALLFDQNGRWKPGAFASIRPDYQAESSELWAIVRTCLELLPAGQADVFMLSAMEGMEYQEICKELKISVSNFWVRLHRARLSLAKCVSSKWFFDEEASE